MKVNIFNLEYKLLSKNTIFKKKVQYLIQKYLYKVLHFLIKEIEPKDY